MIYYRCFENNLIGEEEMFDRPLSKTWKIVKHYLDDTDPRIHEDVELKPGEKVGLVIGNRRYVFALDYLGELSVKTQKRVEKWEDVGEVSE